MLMWMQKAAQATSTNILSTVRSSVSTATKLYVSNASTPTGANADASDTLPNDGIFNGAYDDDKDVGAMADFNNMDNTIAVSPIPTLRIHKDYPKGQILGDPTSAVQTRRKIQKASSAQQALKNPRLYHKPYKIKAGLKKCKSNCFSSNYRIGTKWVFRNKRDERSIVVKNKERLVAQAFRQEEGIYYDEVFAHVARIEAIRLFLAFASYMGFTVYQMDVKSVFLYGTIEEEVYVHQPPGFVDHAHPNKVYKAIKALYGLHQAPRAWYETLSSFLMENGFRRGTIDKTLFIKKKKSDIMLVQVYVDDIIFGSTKKSMCTEFEDCTDKRFQMSSMGELTFFLGLQVKTATTPIESNKPLVKDEDGVDVDVHVYRSMIGSLMYLTASRPDIMFAVCTYARFQVTPKASHLNAVKRIFTYLKHQPKLGLWYPKDSPFELEALHADSDYGGANLKQKTTRVAKYVVAATVVGKYYWIQNQMEDYVSAQAKEIKALKAQVKKLKKGVKPLITHHKAWMKSVALKTRLARNTSGMKRISEKRTKNEAKNDKTEHGMERRGKAKSKSKSIKVKVNPDTVNSQRSKPKPKKY
ncbi:putative ribonuclease H-like domain-containing protein [Tanacetum coccineum]|uniref:Ribonuclease H-like domain-containing protein n=1 Tax=Tanacetum coccineum TaxID=301880 RepID=A0ABQ5I911_9ASTR